MPESSTHASILIAISYQALYRAKHSGKLTIVPKDALIPDCIVVIILAGFFIEANLNQIIEKIGKNQETIDLIYPRKRGYIDTPSLQKKLAWFYGTYVSQPKITTNGELKELYKILPEIFSGFDKILKFRNDISHGIVDSSLTNIKDAEILRKNAISIVDELYEMAKNAGHEIQRTTNYYDAIMR
jgi:hypothetical protein